MIVSTVLSHSFGSRDVVFRSLSIVMCLVDEAQQLPKIELVACGLLLPAPLSIHLHRLLPSNDATICNQMTIL